MIQPKSWSTCLIAKSALHKILQTVVQLLGFLHESHADYLEWDISWKVIAVTELSIQRNYRSHDM